MTDLDPIKDLLQPPPATRVDAIWSRLEAKRGSSSRSYSRLVLGPALGFLVALLAVKLGASRFTSAPAALSLADGRKLGVLEARGTSSTIALSDGSHIELGVGARLVPRTLNDHVFAAELSRGRAVFDVVPNGPRRWLVAAAEVQVSVIGTRFSVEQTTRGVAVSVERGVVEVTGPNVPHGSRRLYAQQSVSVAHRAKSSFLPPTAADTVVPTPAVLDASTRVLTAEPAATHDHDKSESSAQPDPEAIVQLLARADAARSAGRHEQAASILTRLVARYPHDPRAALAAFTLGQLYLEQLARPAQAASAFERACALGLPQALAEQGAARVVEAHARANQPEQARSAAAAYRARFPAGTRRAAVEAWSEKP